MTSTSEEDHIEKSNETKPKIEQPPIEIVSSTSRTENDLFTPNNSRAEKYRFESNSTEFLIAREFETFYESEFRTKTSQVRKLKRNR